jgi:hypothetical protein
LHFTPDGLDLIGMREGTDKGFLLNDYLRHYARILAPYRDLPINVIEIGINKGASLRTWESFFPAARIIGLDITPDTKQYETGRSQVRIGSQADPAFLDAVVQEFPPTVIIDDGSHVAAHQIISFDTLFPKLAAGGCYIVEDLSFQVMPATRADFTGDTAFSAIDYLMSYASNHLATQKVSSPDLPFRRDIQAAVDRVEIIHNAVAFMKRAESRPRPDVIALVSALIQDSPHAAVWWQFYRYLRRNNDCSDITEQALRRAEGYPPKWHFHFLLSEIMADRGDIEGQKAALSRAIEFVPEGERANAMRATLQGLRGGQLASV